MRAHTTPVRPRRGPLSYHEQESIIALYLEGYLPGEIAESLARSRAAVARLIEERGYNPRLRADEVARWVALYLGEWDGRRWSPWAIARRYERGFYVVRVAIAERVGRLRRTHDRERATH